MLTNTIAILALTCSIAAAQPEADRAPPPEQRQAEQDAQRNPEALRKRLLQTLSFAKQIVEKHEAALAQLDAGEDPREVMRSLRTTQSRQGMQMGKRIHSQTLNPDPNQSDQPQPSPNDHAPPPILTKKELKKVRAFIAKHLVDVDAQLIKIEAVSPDSIERLLGRLAPKVLEILHLKNDNSALSALKLDELKAGLFYIDAARLYRGLLRTGSQDKAAVDQAEQQVRKAASARFDAQVHIKQYEIHQLTIRIGQLQEALEDLNAQRNEQVDAQINAARRTPGPRFNRPVDAKPQADD